MRTPDPLDRLMAMNRAYFEFAFENPGYYELMFILKEPLESDYNQEGWEIGVKNHQMLEETVQDCIQAGYFQHTKDDPTALAFSIWSYVHGAVALKIQNRMRMYPKELQESLIDKSAEVMHLILQQ